MYLFTELNPLPLIILLALWALGGWLITSRAALPARERGLVSLGLGLVLGTWFANWLARFMPTAYAFWGAALLTILIGAALAWPLGQNLSPQREQRDTKENLKSSSFVILRDLRGKVFDFLYNKESYQPAQWLLFLFFVFIFTLIGRGFGFFDDHQNLPPVSIMATGDIPPHFSYNPTLGFGYHYFLLLVASQFVRLTSAGPWTALDLARGLTLALTLAYGGFLAYRLTKSRLAEWLSITFMAFAGGARWLFLFLPIQLQRQLSSSIQLIGSGADTGPNLITAIYKNWKIEGLGPLPFPFMFGSGLDASFSMFHNGWGTSAITMVLLIILLAPALSPIFPRSSAEKRGTQGGVGGWRIAIPIVILLASIALANEVTFAFLYFGLAFAALAWMLQHRSIRLPRSLWAWVLLMFIGGLFALVQGGMFTEIARGWVDRQVSGGAGSTYFKVGFALGAPAVLSSHLGLLSLLNPLQWVAILGETGLAVFALPIVLKQLGPFSRDENWFEAAWVGSIIVSLLMVFVQYTGNAGPTAASRMIAHFLTVVKLYAAPLVWLWAIKRGQNAGSAAFAWGLATIFSGLSLFGAQLAAMPNPVYAIYLDQLDSQMFTRHWNQLAPNTMVFDHVYPRAATIFGRPIRSSITMGENLPEFLALDANPDPYKLKAAGYDYLYADEKYFVRYSGLLKQSCVKRIDRVDDKNGDQTVDSRYLFQLTDCRLTMFTQPSRLTFWRLILGIILPVALLSLRGIWILAGKMGVPPLSSRSWTTALGLLALLGIFSLVLLALTWSPRRETLLDGLEAASKATGPWRWVAAFVLFVALTGSFFFILHTYYTDLLRSQEWLRLLIFLLLALLGMNALKILRPTLSSAASFLIVILLQSAIYRIILYLPDISSYPFSMGWSETSRFYWPSLFVSPIVYGQRFPWPILHPTLHLALVPPYLFNAPLWFHRFWQVAVRLLLVGLISPALVSRLKLPALLRWLLGLWIFVYLFSLPLYLHLAVPVFIMLWGFSASNDRRTWIALIAASIWAGVSRLNWYPMPGILAAVLFLLEMPVSTIRNTQYATRALLKPLSWFIIGTVVAFLAQRLYIALSGIPDANNFYTSLTSTLIWERLWPNSSFVLGILPGAILFSLPLWLVIASSLWQRRSDWNPLRVGLIGLALLALFVGGIIVSLKIGGGVDLHNIDAYAVLLMIICAYLLFAHYRPETGQSAAPVVFHWGLAVLLVLFPAWLIMRSRTAFPVYDPAETQATLTALQQRVDALGAQGGEILFITQRHLVAMHMLTGVKLVPEYEREELMEMAMSDNEPYLETFRADLKNYRFAAIVVDPLQAEFDLDSPGMAAENDAWTRYVAKRILCTYQQDTVFPADHIAIYVPQPGAPHCP